MKRKNNGYVASRGSRDAARQTKLAPVPKIYDGPSIRAAAMAITIVLSGAIPATLPFSAEAQLRSSAAQPNPLLTVSSTPSEVATGLNIPWSVVFVGDEILVSERNTAAILAFRKGEKPKSIGKVPNVRARLDGGLLGLAVREDGSRVWIYAYHSTASDNRIVRMSYANGALGNAEVVLQGIPGGRGHNGGRIAFGPDGMLYATTGESQNQNLSQDPKSLGGKILRMTPDGGVPGDNPLEGSLVYSLGHRNPQGLAWDDHGQLWTTDFGDDTWDELNRIEPGKNYGWPVVEGSAGNAAYVDPVLQWRPKEMGPSGLAYLNGTFFIAGLTGKRLWSVTFDHNGKPAATPYYDDELGRIRHVLISPNGNLWLLTNKTDGRGGRPAADDDRILSIPLAVR